MKLIIIFFLLFFSTVSYGQIQFKDHVILDKSYFNGKIHSISYGDLDNDGDQDIVVISETHLAWFEKIDNQNSYMFPKTISQFSESITEIEITDIDGDGDLDIICGVDGLGWFQNLDGKGNFSAFKTITNSFFSIGVIYTCDFDKDGDIDIIVADNFVGKIILFDNIDGKGDFGDKRIIPNVQSGISDLFAGDFDKDGDLDVLVLSKGTSNISWYENIDGQGDFGNIRNFILNLTSANAIDVVDFDKDNDLDVIISTGWIDKKIVWAKNNGEGGFNEIITIADNIDVENVFAIDINGDEELDILTSNGNKIVWYKNNKNGLFHKEQNFLGTSIFFPVDMDEDGDVDIITSNLSSIENIDGFGNFYNQKFINGYVDKPSTFIGADLDNDGDIDLLSGSYEDNILAWYENLDGAGNFISQSVISKFPPSIDIVHLLTFATADIDADGDLDIITSYTDKTIFFLNDGKGVFEEFQIIPTTEKNSILMSDLDNDGDLDLILGSSLNGDVVLFENMNGEATFSNKKQIFKTYQINHISEIDINNNGQKDLLIANSMNLTLLKRKNNGQYTEHILSEFPSILSHTVDIDNDGDMDIVTSNENDITLLINLDGNGYFFSKEIAHKFEKSNFKVDVADIDGDGDIDIVSTSNKNQMLWYENDGSGSFNWIQTISTIENISSFSPVDINGDGKIDIISASFDDNQLTGHQNLRATNTKHIETLNFVIYPNPTSGFLQIKINATFSKIEIFNRLGQKIIENKNQHDIDISNLTNGIYFCKITDIYGAFGIQKIVKK